MHIAGEFDLALKLYESVLQLEPNHADANHNIGLLKLDAGYHLDALPYLQTALQADTSIAQFWFSYIEALINLERPDEAVRIINLAKDNGIIFEISTSARFEGPDDPYRPTNPYHYIDPTQFALVRKLNV